MPIEIFEALAQGAGSPEIMHHLWKTERSRRLSLVTALFDACEKTGDAGPLPPATAAWSIIAQAKVTDRTAVEDLLQHPQIGNAAAYALRRFRGGAQSAFPVWTDLGLLQTIAVIAAARVGLRWSTRLPARYGTVMLPTLGLAKFSSTEAVSTVRARTEAGRIHLSTGGREVVISLDPEDDTDDWWHLRHLNVGRKVPLTVWLDDLDPFRDPGDPIPPARLDDAAFERWRDLLDDAWALLCEHHADTSAALAEAVVSVVPLPDEPARDARSASNGEAFGSVLVSEAPDPVTLAATLVHEFQYVKLSALRHLLALTTDDDALYYAPWRSEPRPLGGVLQGIYAYFGTAEFWRRHRLAVSGADALRATYEYLYARGQTVEALRSVRDVAALTDTGRDLVRTLGSVLDTWRADRVEPEAARLARLAVDCHRTAWRLRHRRVAAGEVAVLAKAWLDRRPPEIPSDPHVGRARALRRPQRVSAFARGLVLGTTDPDTSGDPLAAADLELVKGNADVARRAYLTRLHTPSDGSDDETLAWVGLTLALSDDDRRGDAATALRTRPDLVRAVHTDTRVLSRRPVDPVEIAVWLAPVVTGT